MPCNIIVSNIDLLMQYTYLWYTKVITYPKYTSILQETGVQMKLFKKKKETVTLSECRQHILAINDALDILRGKWKIQIIGALIFGKKRFKELQREVGGITAKMLSKELRDLEMNELVIRSVHDTIPVTVEYELTDYGATLQKVIDELHAWGTKHRKRIIKKSA